MYKIINIIKEISKLYSRIKYSIRSNIIKKDVEIGNDVHLRKCNIGAHCYIGPNSIINHAEIGPYCSIAPGVQIGGMEHSLWYLSTNTHLSDECIFGKETVIEADVWIAAGCIIKQGVRIEQGAVIGANSFVNCDIPPYAIAVGSPAKVIKYRFDESKIKKLLKSEYWKYAPQKARKILQDLA